jgi:hypothetical protein
MGDVTTGGSDMKRTALAAAAALLLAATPAAAGPAGADLAWMAGAWIQEEGGVTTRETWLAPLGGAMAGVGQTTRPGGKTSFEFMSITPEAAGLTFTARIEGQTPTPFVLKPGPAGEAVFENLAHDFPQRIIYRQCGEDLCGRIEGMMDGKAQAFDWRYRRAK